MPAIGIDLGTTFSRVAVYRNGAVEVITNEGGKRKTPSFVAFSTVGRSVGDEAKNQLVFNPKNTIFDMKRLIGRRLSDPIVQNDIPKWPFEVFSENRRLKISVEFQDELKNLTPEEITAMILVKMKEIAEKYLNETVTDAVITVPAYFTNAQRKATKDAAVISGLNVLHIINEPTAAALAYSINAHLKSEQNILIYDLGGGTFDVSIVKINANSLEVCSTVGDTHLGGEDFNERLVKYFISEFMNEHRINLMENERAVKRLQMAAERIKRTLSVNCEAVLGIYALCDGIDFHKRVSRARFEDLCIDLFKLTLCSVEKALIDANLDKSQIDNIVLVGGSTKIPKIQSLLSEFFDDIPLMAIIHPEEAVVHGAAIQAHFLSGDQICSEFANIRLLDVTPLSLGIESAGGVMNKIIERNTRIPCKKTKTFTTFDDNQPGVTVEIFEGERTMTKYNNVLGKFELSGIPSTSRGSLEIEVTFEIDANGILSATAMETISGRKSNIVIENAPNRLSKWEIDQMLVNAEQYMEEDKKQRNRIVACNNLECFIFNVKRAVDENDERLSYADRNAVLNICKEALDWIEENRMAEKEMFEDKMKEMTAHCMRLHNKMYLETITEEVE